jgi:parallel beta-helix repeat protein
MYPPEGILAVKKTIASPGVVSDLAARQLMRSVGLPRRIDSGFGSAENLTIEHRRLKMNTKARFILTASTTVLGMLLALTIMQGLAQKAYATSLDVCPICTYTTIQAAVHAASNGDTIRVTQGYYTGVMVSNGDTPITATIIITKNLTLLGGFNADFSQRDPQSFTSTIDGEAQAWSVIEVVESDAIVDGFSIVNSMGGSGIRVYSSTVQIRNNRIEGNSKSGIGIYDSPSILIEGNTIVSNTTAGNGGGILAQGTVVTITQNFIANNMAYGPTEGGGGIFLGWSYGVVEENEVYSNTSLHIGGGIELIWGSSGIVQSNTVAYNHSGDVGGGIEIRECGLVTVAHNRVYGNSSGDSSHGVGGGILTVGNTIPTIIEQNEVYSNTTHDAGGGIDVRSPAVINGNFVHHNKTLAWGTGIGVFEQTQPVTITNNVVVTNTSNGIWAVNTIDARIINNTVVNNTYDGISGWAWPITPTTPLTTTILNNIVVNNGGCGVNGYNGAILIIDYNDIQGNANDYCALASPPNGLHNISSDPQFVNAAGNDFHIRYGSPAMDKGTTIWAPAFDKDGIIRPQGVSVDIGAYEIVIFKIYLPLIAKQ